MQESVLSLAESLLEYAAKRIAKIDESRGAKGFEYLYPRCNFLRGKRCDRMHRGNASLFLVPFVFF